MIHVTTKAQEKKKLQDLFLAGMERSPFSYRPADNPDVRNVTGRVGSAE
jgi:hypothetical protein